MTDKLISWAIFGVIAIIWNYAYGWAAGEVLGDQFAMMFVTFVTLSLIAGKTSGDNAIGHVIEGAKGCLVLLIGWAVASIVYNAVSGLIYTQSVDPMGLVNGALDAVAVALTSVLMFSALNAVRD